MMSKPVPVARHRAAVFAAAFLLFMIQPMSGRSLTAPFGGSVAVWGACMVFYQAVLLLAYLYAHAVQRRFGVVRYGRWHGLLLLAGFACLALRPEWPTAAAPQGPLTVAVVGRLAASVGLPVFALAATSVLVQRWLSVSTCPGSRYPYALYGASNLGSLLGLLCYPAVVEPLLSLPAQRALWWAGYAATALLILAAAPRGAEPPEEPLPASRQQPSRAAAWFLLSAAGCMALFAVTNVITIDVAAAPLLWVPPLAAYLLAYVLAFRQRPWCPAGMRHALRWAVILGIHLHLMLQVGLALPAWLPIAVHLAVLFVVCLNCNARLVESRPDPSGLTGFYVVLALGGLCGGLLVSWAVPVLSASLVEYPLALLAVATALAVARGEPARGNARLRGWIEGGACVLIIAAATLGIPWLAGTRGGADGAPPRLLALAAAMPAALALRLAASRPWQFAAALAAVTLFAGRMGDLAAGASRVATRRNYYGLYQVFDRGGMRYLKHGTTLHGRQRLDGPDARAPVGYYHSTTPVGEVLGSPRFSFRRIGMIGLGTGAMAAYARAGQSLAVFELDPDNRAIAERYFTYLDTARRNGVKPRFVWGDGRLSLRREPAGGLDLLVIDAFSSGAIPVHLITVDAFREYARALSPEGLILLHLSRKVLNLAPVVASDAAALGLYGCEKTNAADLHPDAESTHWAALTRSPRIWRALTDEAGGWTPFDAGARRPRPWTDRYSNLLGALLARPSHAPE